MSSVSLDSKAIMCILGRWQCAGYEVHRLEEGDDATSKVVRLTACMCTLAERLVQRDSEEGRCQHVKLYRL